MILTSYLFSQAHNLSIPNTTAAFPSLPLAHSFPSSVPLIHAPLPTSPYGSTSTLAILTLRHPVATKQFSFTYSQPGVVEDMRYPKSSTFPEKLC